VRVIARSPEARRRRRPPGLCGSCIARDHPTVAAWAARARGSSDRIGAGIDVLTGYEITPEQPTPVGRGHEVRRAAHRRGRVTGLALTRARASRAALPWLATRLRAGRAPRRLDLAAGPVMWGTAPAWLARAAGDDLPTRYSADVISDRHRRSHDHRTDHRDPDTIFTIPRRGELVLGGCAIRPPGAPAIADPDITGILEQARGLGLAVGAVREVRAGSAVRLQVRLERDATDRRILHNYGHGGAGFTLCRGCAEEVGRLIAAM
jgi:D-amino-acid oxidase